MAPLLSVRGLKTHFNTREGVVPAVDGVSFDLEPGGALGVVGESGCGKSVLALSLMGLVPSGGEIVAGEVLFDGKNLLRLSPRAMSRVRGNDIAMIFQEPQTSLNPVYSIGYQIIEAIVTHQRVGRKEARAHAVRMLDLVGIPSPARRIDDYPHQLSGGMRQRVMIAMALSCSPKLLIADEPTTALDVTIQAQILDLLMRIREETGTTLIFITHDLGVVAEVAQDALVMYAGKVVEHARVDALFAHPKHPYTIGLLNSVPSVHEEKERLSVIEGAVPNPLDLPSGCRFHPRCRWAEELCRAGEPGLEEHEAGGKVACFAYSGFEAAPRPGGSLTRRPERVSLDKAASDGELA